MLLVVDIDGTLADPTARFKKAGNEPNVKDPVAYQKWLDVLQAPGTLIDDPVIKPVAELVRTLEQTGINTVVYLTGRSDIYRTETTRWLEKNRLPSGPIIMRRADEYNKAGEYKRSAMRVLATLHEGDDILVIDDDPSGDCSDMYRELGAVHLKVLAGGVK